MQDPILHDLKILREHLFKAIHYRADACLELLDSLCSNTTAKSPVQLSLNPHHRRSYNSITDTLSEFHKGGDKQEEDIFSALLRQVISNKVNNDYYLLATDCTSSPREHSPTLADRTVVYKPNQTGLGNKPITIGHKYSTVCALNESKISDSSWVIPVTVARVKSTMNEVMLGAEQLQHIVDKLFTESPDKIVISTVDSAYGMPEYIDKLHCNNSNQQLISVIRARSNRVFWQQAKTKKSDYGNKRGHERWYGDKFSLNDRASWHEPDEVIATSSETTRGKMMQINIKAWHNMLRRDIKGLSMHKHPFTLLQIIVTNSRGEQMFHKPMWLMVYGKHNRKLSVNEIYQCYLKRYDIEHYFRFQKRNLLADKLQTTSVQHAENWWSICLIAYAILFASHKAIEKVPRPWETYLRSPTEQEKTATPSMAQRQFSFITSQIGSPARPPKPRGNPLGRRRGVTIAPLKRHEVIFKAQSPPKPIAA